MMMTVAIGLACVSARGQELQDSLQAADLMQELHEVVVKGNLPDGFV